MMEHLQFKISSFLKDLIGRELITDEFVAVFELVKNSFDANAKHVQIVFENQHNPETAKIIIRDDGRGMDNSDLINKWLFVAHSAKRDGSEDKDYRDKIKNRRVFAGAKGVGRFSCDRLGKFLNLITAKDLPNAQIENLRVDWTSFEEDSNKEFIDIKVIHNTLQAVDYKGFSHGTILEISGLRDVWNRERLQKLKFSLEKLINPLQENDSSDFDIEIIAPDELIQDKNEKIERNKVNGKIKNFIFETLGLKTTEVKVEIIENGGVVKTTLVDRGRQIYCLKEKNNYRDLSNVTINLFYLNRSAKYNFYKMMNVNSVVYGSVFIYKNGFRIYPFGEEGDDTLQIDRRKQQGYRRHLGTRDLIGRIEINGEHSNLKETTSRDGGLIKNDAYRQLCDMFYEKALRRLEKYSVDTIKWGDDRTDKETGKHFKALNPEDVKGEIIDIITNLTKAKDVIDITYDNDFLEIFESIQEKSASQLVKNFTRIAEGTNNPELVKQAKAVEKSLIELKEAKREAEDDALKSKAKSRAIKQKFEQISTENLFLRSDVNKDIKEFESLQHHITHTSNTISAFASKAVEAIKNNDKEKAFIYLNQILFENKKIATLSNFVSKAKFDTMTNKIDNDLVSFMNEYINNVYSITNNNLSYHIESNNPPFRLRFVPIEMIIILDNLLSNSSKAKAKNITLEWKVSEKEALLFFRDDGIGISDDDLVKVFEYRFSTTKGAGLGLYHIKDIMDKMKGKIEINNRLKKGVEFIFTFRK